MYNKILMPYSAWSYSTSLNTLLTTKFIEAKLEVNIEYSVRHSKVFLTLAVLSVMSRL